MRSTILILLLAFVPTWSATGQDFTADQVAFFESRIRPVLVQSCGECHARGQQSKGGLQLTAREHLLQGGDSGPTIVPGDPKHSVLLSVLRHEEGAPTEMPPDDQLTDQQIEDFSAWVEMGAPWPDSIPDTTASDEPAWALQPLSDGSVPEVNDWEWPRNAIDRFILAGLEEAGLSPAPEASREVWLRRVTFDLVGLPPTPEEVEAFIGDGSDDAYERVVDRLLASPHYGERWGRHWLDLVRYSDTNGLDNDYEKPGSYHYRDYVIQAFNADVPYDNFVREHIAGEVVSPQRVSAEGSHYWSPLGTGFYWLGEMLNAPTQQDVALAIELENRIDVLGKTFLGLTVACARCHDHKFDDISSDDYYALGGILTSSNNVQACVDTPQRKEELRAAYERSRANREAMDTLLEGRAYQKVLAQARLEEAHMMAAYMMACRPFLASEEPVDDEDLLAAAQNHQLDPSRLRKWLDFLSDEERETDPIFAPWIMLADVPEKRFDRRVSSLASRLADVRRELESREASFEVFEDFEGDTWSERWHAEGMAFGSGPRHHIPADMHGVRGNGYVSSFQTTDAAVGRLTSKKFTVTKRYMTMLVAGGEYRGETSVNVIFNSPVLPEPEDVVKMGRNDRVLRREWFNLQPYLGEEVYIEIADSRRGPWGHIIIDEIAFSDDDYLPKEYFSTNRLIQEMLSAAESPQSLAEGYQHVVVSVLEKTLDLIDTASDHNEGVVRFEDRDHEAIRFLLLGNASPLAIGSSEEFLPPEDLQQLQTLRLERESIDFAFPESTIGIVTKDFDPDDMATHLQGDVNNLGDKVPRGFLHALSDDPRPDELTGSGRTELADWLSSPNNPLTSRVMVNRIWKHHFATGLVATPDNFGQLGEKPSHAELLDYLARQFITSGWSVKEMHRHMVLSSTYRQSNEVDPLAAEEDSNNRLLHHMPIRQLEAESVRDAILAVAGNINYAMYGPGVNIHFTPYTIGEDLPLVSGPLDGDRRRSIYLEVRSNHLMALLEAFHMPRPATTTGTRDRSVTTPMALSMMNSEFVATLSHDWATRILEQYPGNDEARLARMIYEAYSREATPEELQSLGEFVTEQIEQYRQLSENGIDPQQQAWADLGQVLFSVSEFSFVR